MKMKKLTALALAGVLCLGMSATAFAADSPVRVDGENTKITITEKNEITGEETKKDLEGTIEVGTISNKYANDKIAEWTAADDATDEEKAEAQEALEKDMAEAVENANKELPADEQIKLDPNAKYLYTGSAADYYFVDENGNQTELPEGAEATIRFNLKNVAGIEDAYKVGSRTIYLMHAVTDEYGNTSFVMLTGEIKVGVNGYYTDVTFKNGLSPVAFILEVPQNGGGNNGSGDNGNIVVPNPDDDNTVTPVPGADGKVTVDDIANAVVKKLQSSNAKVIRTGTGVSPKTGE